MNVRKYKGVLAFNLEREHEAAKFCHNLTGIFSLAINNRL